MKHIKYTKDLLKNAVAQSFSYAGVLRFLGLKQAGGTQTHIINTIQKFEIDTSHFTGKGHNKGKQSNNKLKAEQILIKLPDGSVRQKRNLLLRALLEINRPYTCSECDVKDLWNGKKLILHIDHVDGDFLNNTPENLRFLCPNCHSQTITYCCNKSKLAGLAK